MNLKYKAILFDVDGTMVDNMSVHIQAWIKYLSSFGIHLNPESVHQIVAGKTSAEVVRSFFPELTNEQVDLNVAQKEMLYKHIYKPIICEISGLTSFIERAHAMGIKMAVASAGGIDIVEFVIKNLNISHYFDAIISAQDIKNGKPDPEIFLLAANRLDIDSQACLVIEDSLAGLQGAHNAGMKSIAITTGYPVEKLIGYPSVIKVINDYCNLDLESIFELVPD